MFENSVVRGLCVLKRDEVTGKWIKPRNEELNNLYCSPNIVWVIKSRRIKWAGHVARMAAGRSPAEIVGSNPTGGMDICLL